MSVTPIPNGEALPCPFCGEADLRMNVYADEAFVQCLTCTCCGPNGNETESAMIQWNNREKLPDA